MYFFHCTAYVKHSNLKSFVYLSRLKDSTIVFIITKVLDLVCVHRDVMGVVYFICSFIHIQHYIVHCYVAMKSLNNKVCIVS